MPVSTLFRLFLVVFASASLAACEVIGDIFQAGMAVGIFLVIAVVALGIYLIGKVRSRV